MYASKVKFSQETKAALNARPLSKLAKAKLRRERVKDYIRSQPAGAIIKQSDLAIVAGYDKSQGHGWGFINRMVEKGHIIKDTSEGSHKPSWVVKGDANTVKPPKTPIVPLSEPVVISPKNKPDIISFVADMQRLGVKFTITISNKPGQDEQKEL